MQKKPATVLGPEPDRDWLTDPPKGYREPAEGAGVKVETIRPALCRAVASRATDRAIETTP